MTLNDLLSLRKNQERERDRKRERNSKREINGENKMVIL